VLNGDGDDDGGPDVLNELTAVGSTDGVQDDDDDDGTGDGNDDGTGDAVGVRHNLRRSLPPPAYEWSVTAMALGDRPMTLPKLCCVT
jgi:hypothetical protein